MRSTQLDSMVCARGVRTRLATTTTTSRTRARWGFASTLARRPRPRATVAALGDVDDLVVGPALDGVSTSAALAPFVASAVGVACVRAWVHFALQYAAAKTLGARVPEEALVVELGVDTKNLYYYPKSTRLVVGVDPDVNEDLMNRIGIETGTPVLPRSAPIAGKAVMDGETVWGQRAGTVDCVVSTGRLEKLSGDEVETVAKKAAMALRPGGRYVFVEPAGGNRGQALFDALEATGAFESPISFDEQWATLPVFPHAVGVAIKKTAESARANEKESIPRRRRRR